VLSANRILGGRKQNGSPVENKIEIKMKTKTKDLLVKNKL